MVGAVAPLAGAKTARSMRARIAALEPWLAWNERLDGPVVWIHAASVGEMLTAQPVLRRVKVSRPDAACVLTFTSPSAADWPPPRSVSRTGYLPPADRTTMDALFAHLQPTVLVFARGDLWPGLVAAARRHRVPVLLMSAAVRPGSSRLHRVLQPVLRPTYGTVRWAGAVSHGDALRLRQLGVLERAIQITGDARHDQILERETAIGPIRDVLSWAGTDPVVVAGSTHPEDEAVLLPAFRALAACHRARLVLVPHEPSPARAAALAAMARAMTLPVTDDMATRSTETRVIVSSSTGMLADLYAAATLAYVGGGFGRGLHAVAEPAAFGVPVTFGVRDTRPASADAVSLIASGGGAGVPRRNAVRALTEQWLRWLDNPAGAREAGLAARRTVQGGAADASAGAILECC